MLIALTGKKGHGKTTAARILEHQGFAHLNFADPVKEVAKLVYGLTDEEIDDPVLKETPLERWPFKTPRDILQKIGTNMFRNYVPDTWTQNHRLRSESHDRVVASDLRFLNEAAAIRKRGGIVVRVFDPRKPVDGGDESTKHASEMEMDQIKADFEIINDGSINELHSKMYDIYQRMLAQGWADAKTAYTGAGGAA